MTEEYRGAIAAQKNQRKKMATNDILAFKLKAGGFLFGRVLDGDSVFGAAALIVTYDFILPVDSPDRVRMELRDGSMLIPPVNVGYLALKSGLARTIANCTPGEWESSDRLLVLRSSADSGPESVRFVPEEKSFRMRDRSRESNRVFDLNGRPVESPKPPYGHVGGAGGLIMNDAAYAGLLNLAMASVRRR